MTELTFLIDLLLNHKLPKTTRDAVAGRIKDVEGHFVPSLGAASPSRPSLPSHLPHEIAKQAPSMQAIMPRHPDLVKGGGCSEPGAVVTLSDRPEPQPVAVIAQNAATAAAMASRNQAIAESMSGKVDKNTGRPRKF